MTFKTGAQMADEQTGADGTVPVAELGVELTETEHLRCYIRVERDAVTLWAPVGGDRAVFAGNMMIVAHAANGIDIRDPAQLAVVARKWAQTVLPDAPLLRCLK